MDANARSPVAVAAIVGVLVGGAAVYGGAVTGVVPPGEQPGSPDPGSDEPSAAVAGAQVWLDGRVERVADGTIYLDVDGAAVPVAVPENAGLFRCRPGGGADLECRPTDLGDVRAGGDVCASVYLGDDALRANKVFVDAVCGGPRAPPS